MISEAVNQGYVNCLINEDGIATIEFGHPLSNSLPGKVLSLLSKTISDLGNDDRCKVIILTSGGEKAFCAGASFDELISIKEISVGKVFFSGFANVINACRKCPKIIIGRIQGKAVGGGVGMAAACDYSYATKYADVKLSELAVGIGPFVVGPVIERKIGLSAFSQLAINATEWRTADWAKSKGLYVDVFEEFSEMDEEIKKLSTQLSKSNPMAMKMMKEIFWKGTEHWDDLLLERAAMSGELVLSDFSKNAINQFKNK